MSDNKTTFSGGIGFFGLLTILFIGLKLVNVINWSWWLVLLPMWGWFALAAVIFVGWMTVVGLIGLVMVISDR